MEILRVPLFTLYYPDKNSHINLPHQPPLKITHKKRGAITNSSFNSYFDKNYFTIDS